MWIGVVTLFPEFVEEVVKHGIVGRAFEDKLISLHCFNPREFTERADGRVDDKPFGGGSGMLMQAAPLRKAIQKAKEMCPTPNAKVILLSPSGVLLTQDCFQNAAEYDGVIFVLGRYLGVDYRIIEHDIDAVWSIGDYVLSGGELPVMVCIDAITRLLPGSMNDDDSRKDESFASKGLKLLECPHYTRPNDLDGQIVPDVLLSGDHQRIKNWRMQKSLGRTFRNRPDLLIDANLSQKQLSLLADEIRNEIGVDNELT